MLFIHQQTGFKHFKNSIKFLNILASNIQGNFKVTIVVADNSIKKIELVDGVYVVPCSNRYREFSGWSEALVYGKALLSSQECNVILSNETMLTHRPFDGVMKNAFIEAFDQCFASIEPAYAGDMDQINVSPPYYHSNRDLYISTYLCGMNWACIKLFDSIIPRADYEENFMSDFNCDSVISENSIIKNTDYGLMLENYLYKSEQNVKIKKWWDHNQLNDGNFHKFRLKFLAMLIEAGISQHAQEKGCKLIDMKEFSKRNFLQYCDFFLRKIKFSVGWRLNRYRRKMLGSL